MCFIVGLCLIFGGGTSFGCEHRVGSGAVAGGPGGGRFHDSAVASKITLWNLRENGQNGKRLGTKFGLIQS